MRKPLDHEIIKDEQTRAKREAANGIVQAEAVQEMVDYYLDPERPFSLRPSLIYRLHEIALDGLSTYAGKVRPGPVEIGESVHAPIAAHLVEEGLRDMCDWVNENWGKEDAITLASYVMWRLNWIHPFPDGNGRTSRAVSYLVLNVKLGCLLPGTKTIPEFIVSNRGPYFDALSAADAAWRDGRLDLAAMKELMEGLLAAQLLTVIDRAKGL